MIKFIERWIYEMLILKKKKLLNLKEVIKQKTGTARLSL